MLYKTERIAMVVVNLLSRRTAATRKNGNRKNKPSSTRQKTGDEVIPSAMPVASKAFPEMSALFRKKTGAC